MNASTPIRCRRPRAMTLIELLIVIAIIGGLFALVWPTMSSELDEWSFRSTTEQIEAQLLLTRSESMRSRSPLEVVYVEIGERREIRARPFVAGLREIDQSNVRGARGSDENQPLDAFFESSPADVAAESELGSWARLRLSDDMQLLESLPESFRELREEGEALDLSADELDEFGLELEAGPVDSYFSEETQIRLAIYLGDGTALVSNPVWLIDETGRLAALRINPWTGAPSVEREARLEDEESTEIDEDDLFDVDDGPTSQPDSGGGS